ncbi:MAG: signal peptide peptidase SppA [Thermoplasmataceae archaeon]|jgi:protease-4
MAIARVRIAGNINRSTAAVYQSIFEHVRTSRKFKAVTIEISSGGGDATSSQILFESVKALNREKPVYSLISGVGASGAYWVATASRKIYAMSTSLVGSIGIISINPNIKGLLEKLGIEMNVYKIGKYKDLLSPFSSEAPEEGIRNFRESLNDVFAVFRETVAQQRNISEEEMETIATGEVFSSKKALSLRLIDKIGGYQEMLDDMKENEKVQGNVRQIQPRRSFISRFIGGMIYEFLSQIQ